MQQLVDDGGLRLAGCVPQPPDPVAAEKLGDGPLPGLFRFWPFLFVFAVGYLGFEFCVFVVGWSLGGMLFGVSGLLLL